MKLGNRIKELRESQGLLQRQLSAQLEIDTPMFSKIERGERRAKREQVLKIAVLLKADEQELLALWLTDQIMEIVTDEEQALQALQIAEKELLISEYPLGTQPTPYRFPKRNRLIHQSISAYYEIRSCHLYIVSKATNKEYPWSQTLSLAFGLLFEL